MDTFVDSAWYFLRYVDAMNPDECFGKQEADYWMNVDFYCGGIEHAQMHLIYARFWTKALRDLGLHTISEPFQRLLCQGMVNSPAPFCEACNVTLHVDYTGKPCPTCGELLTIHSCYRHSFDYAIINRGEGMTKCMFNFPKISNIKNRI